MKKGWLIGGAILGCTLGASLGACSSSSNNGTGNSVTTSSTGTGTGTGTGGTTSSSSSGTTSSGTTSSSTGTGGASCSPDESSTECQCASTLHPPSAEAGAPGPYCPFAGDGGGGIFCPNGQECCETASEAGVPSQCMGVDASTCPSGSTTWSCDDPSECPSGMMCCAIPYTGQAAVNILLEPAVNGQTCMGHYAQYMQGTICATTCATGEVQMCTSTTECPSGKTCVPFRKAGDSVGACQ